MGVVKEPNNPRSFLATLLRVPIVSPIAWNDGQFALTENLTNLTLVRAVVKRKV